LQFAVLLRPCHREDTGQEFRLPYSVTVQPSARQFLVESDETILAAAIRQGVGMAYSCRDGVCGTCRCRILEGRVRALRDRPDAVEPGYAKVCSAYADSDVVLESAFVAAAGMPAVQKMPCRVVGIRRAAADVAILRLETPRNRALEYRPGQYVELSLRDGTRRKFSLATADGSAGLEFHIRLLPGGSFSGHVDATLKEKDVLHLEGPFGTFLLQESSDPIVMLASGTGFAPIKAMLESVKARGVAVPIKLYWGCRRRGDLYLNDWVERLQGELPWLEYVPVLSEPSEADSWTGRTGLVHRAVMADLPDLRSCQVYACGVPIMVESARADFTSKCGLREVNFHADSFVAAAPAKN
jgi:CDP-4-dehydro-6-deoxyglucose reductase